MAAPLAPCTQLACAAMGGYRELVDRLPESAGPKTRVIPGTGRD